MYWVLTVVVKIFLTAADTSSKMCFVSMEIMNYQETTQQINEHIFYNTQQGKGYVAANEAIILFVSYQHFTPKSAINLVKAEIPLNQIIITLLKLFIYVILYVFHLR
jgi:hypothetical protein